MTGCGCCAAGCGAGAAAACLGGDFFDAAVFFFFFCASTTRGSSCVLLAVCAAARLIGLTASKSVAVRSSEGELLGLRDCPGRATRLDRVRASPPATYTTERMELPPNAKLQHVNSLLWK